MNSIEQIPNPGEYYQAHAAQLNEIGATAFGQPVEVFGPDVAHHFAGATVGQLLRADNQVAGFALYDLLRGSHWRAAFTGRNRN